jgi:hypothetical protein
LEEKRYDLLRILKKRNMKPTFRKTIKDNRLEELSDKVRRGIPIGMGEAMEVIEYQEQLKKNKLPFTDRILKFFKVK